MDPELDGLLAHAMSRRAFGRLALVGLAGGSLLAGCGGDDNSEGGRVKLKFWKYQDPATQPVFESLIKRYNSENPRVEVVLETFPFDQYLAEKVSTAMSAGSGPDVFWVSAATLLNFAPAGLLLPLDDAFTEQRSDFLPQTLEAVTLGESVYGVPHEMGIQGLLYDKKLFAELGLEPPTSWDTLIDTAAKIKTRTRWGIILPTAPDVFQNFIWWPFLWMGGGEVVSEDFTQARINEEPGVRAFELWGELIERELASPKSSGPFGEELAQGKAGMAALGMWVVGNYRKEYPDVEIGVAPLPTPEPGGQSTAAFGGWYTTVSAATKHPKEAKDFAVWLFGEDPENAVELTKTMTVLSPRTSVTEQLEQLPEFKEPPLPEFFDIWESTRPEPAYPPEIQKAVTDALQGVMFSGRSAQQAADTAAAQIEKYLKSPEAAKIKEIMA